MRGFTLIEISMVLGIFTVLLVLGLFMSVETLQGTVYRSEQATVVSLLERARSLSMSNIEQSSWGVCYSEPNYIVFKGSSCTASAAYEVTPANMAVVEASNVASAFPTIVFTQLSGTTTPAQILIVQDSRTRITTVNNEGAIFW